MHLLVIEDERALCETIVRSLRRLAYSVDYCYDGEKALELLGVERYDLVLLDLNLPKKDGMTVLRTLRQTDRETRVLILSARSEVEDKVQGLDAKEYDLIELLMKNPRRVYSRESLMDLVWGYSYAGDYRTVDVHIRRLREKLEPDPANPVYIMTKWGVGYYFTGEEQPTV